jgi:thioredoxin reductase
MTTTEHFDAVIVGGGPGGLSAALTLGRAGRDTLLLDTGQGRNAPAEHMQNVLGHDGKRPGDLRAAGRRELGRYPTVTVREVAAEAAERSDDDVFTVTLAGGEVVAARRLVLATGVVDELLDIPGLAELWGRSFLHCPYCHGNEQRGRALAVLGDTSHHAFIATLLRRSYSDDVVMLTNGGQAPVPDVLTEQDVPVHDQPITALDGRDGRLERVVFADGSALGRDAIFGGMPFRQRSDLAAQLGCATIGPGCVEVDDLGHTSVPGVLAVGDMAQRSSMPGPMAAVSFASAAGMLAGVAVDQALHAEAVGIASPLLPGRVVAL